MSELKSIYMSSVKTKLSAFLIKKDISALKRKLNPDTVGGTALLGISKPVIKAHGSSNAIAIASAIRQASNAVNSDIAARLEEKISKMKVEDQDATGE
jgi:glycerol-3-phosphate acyltransferase PlsX